MKNTDFSIKKIHQYIDGDLTPEESLYVEQQLAHDEQWRDAYEGLVFAQDHQINTQEITQKLEKRLPKLEQKKSPIIQLSTNKRWYYAAASIIGIVFVSFGLIYLLNHAPQNEIHAEASAPSGSTGFYPEDQIQIIPSRPDKPIKEQHFNSEKIDALAKLEPREIDDYGASDMNLEKTDNLEYSADAMSDLESNSAQVLSKSASPSSSNLLERYGYSEVSKPNLFNTTRGANARGNFSPQIVKHSLSPSEINSVKENYEQSYVARFPFNGVVKTQFIINPSGQVENFKVLNTPNKEMAEVVQQLAEEKIQWGIPKTKTGVATSELVNLEVSFGNTISINIAFAGS